MLRLLGVEMTTYSSVAVPRAGDSDLLVSGQSLMPEGSMAAGIFQDTDGTIKLVRGATSEQAGLVVVPSVDHVVRINLRQEAAVTASASSAWVGQKLRFAATVPPGVDPATVTYEWYFNDASGTRFRTPDAVIEHRFPTRGTYNVTVTFYVDGKIVGGNLAAFTTVEILSKEKVDDGYAPEQEGNTGKTAGPKGKGVNDAPQEDAPDDAAPDAPDVQDTYDDGGYNGDSGSGYTPPAAAATPPATPDPAPSPPVRRAARRAPVRRAAPELPQGETVDGYLLASASGVPVVPSAAVTPADQDLAKLTKPPTADGALHVPTGVWVALGLLLLVVLGWGLESRTTLPYFRP
jgi:hypothetical protein